MTDRGAPVNCLSAETLEHVRMNNVRSDKPGVQGCFHERLYELVNKIYTFAQRAEGHPAAV